MRFFRRRRKPESGEEEKELVLDTDAEAQALAQDSTETEAEASLDTPTPDAAAEAAAPQGDLLAQISAETDAETKAEEEAPETEGGSPHGDDSLDPDLLDIFRSAKNEVQESTLASELDDIPAQDLLSDLVGVSHRLRAMPRPPAEPGQDRK